MKMLKIYSLALLLLVLTGCVFALASCDQTPLCPDGHTEVTDAAVAATCTTAGLTQGSHCSVCNTILTEQQKLEPLAHDPDKWIVTLAPTCLQEGSQYRKCKDCNTIIETQVLEKHNFENWVETKAASCTQAGEKLCQCEECGTVQKQSIPALGHQESSTWTKQGNTPCTQSGLEAIQCTRCDAVLKTRTRSARAHTLGAPTVISPVNCGNDGIQAQSCTKCNYVKTEVLTASANHNWTSWVTDILPVSCQSDGTRHRECRTCQALEVEKIPASAHTFGSWSTVKTPNCTQIGEKQRECSVCQYIEILALPVTDTHIPGNVEILLEATDTTDGIKQQLCTVCEKTLVYEIIPATGAPLTYVIQNNTITVTGYLPNAPAALTIPTILHGLPVTKIACGAFQNATCFTSITLPATLTQIEAGAFEGCSALVSANGLTTLSGWLISVDPAKMEITIPTTVKKIANDAFANCHKLVHVTNLAGITLTGLPQNKGLEVRTSTSKAFTNTLATAAGITVFKVGSTNYLINSTLTTLDLTNTAINAIYSCALTANKTVKTVILPQTLSDIGQNAFTDTAIETLSANLAAIDHIPYAYLKALTIIGSPVEIPSNFLSGCDTLEVLSIPNTVLVSRKGAFAGCTGVKTLSAPAGALSALDLENLELLYVTAGTSIPASAFNKHQKLKEVHIAPSVEKIGAQAFYNCSALEIFVFEDIENSKLNTLGNYLFCSDTKLTTLVLPEGITTIPSQCFSGCTGLTSITLPNTLIEIAYESFQNCTSLTSITIPASVKYLNNYPDSTVRGVFEGCTKLASVTFASGSQLTLISNYCFYNCKALTSITIPESVTSIGKNAFKGSGVTSITFKNTSNWKLYSITSVSTQVASNGFQNLGTGTAVIVTTPATNATNFKNKYVDYVWVRG